MDLEFRRLIRIRGSYLVYLPKVVMERSEAEEVEMFWEGRYVGVKPVGRFEADLPCRGSVAVIVAGYAAGLDKVKINADLATVEKALEKIFAEVEKEGDYYVVRYIDKYVDKETVVDRMFEVLLHALRGVAKGTANLKTLQAADDESDRLRLTLNRLCARRPTPSCAFYLQLARFYERAVDHVVELYPEKPAKEIWATLLEAAETLAKAVESRRGDQLVAYLEKAPSYRFALLQHATTQTQALHSARTLDYLVNSAEVHLDRAIYLQAKFTPGRREKRKTSEEIISREIKDT